MGFWDLFKDAGGHHGLAQSSFGEGYNPGEHVTVGSERMAENGYKHPPATAAQQRMFRAAHRQGLNPTPAFYDAVNHISAREMGMGVSDAMDFTSECRARANELGDHESRLPWGRRKG